MDGKITTTFTVPGEHLDLFAFSAAKAVELHSAQVSHSREGVLDLARNEDIGRGNEVTAKYAEANALLGQTALILAESCTLYANVVGTEDDGQGNRVVEARPAVIADVLEVLAQDLAPAMIASRLAGVPIEIDARETIKEASEAMNWALECSIPMRDLAAASSDPTNGGSAGPIK